MRKMIRTALAVFLALLLPLSAAADSVCAWTARLEMQAEPEDRSLAALAELLEALEAEGTFARTDDGVFELNLTVGVPSQNASRTPLCLRGTDALWILTSPLLGDEQLLFHNENLPEYFNKLQDHLSLPLAPLALLNPYSSEAALEVPVTFTRQVMQPGEIPPETAAAYCTLMADLARTDRAHNWLLALGGDSGLAEDFPVFLESLPDWLAAYAPDGLTVTVTDAGEAWYRTGAADRPLFTRSADGAAWTLSLPGAWNLTPVSDDWEDEVSDWEEDWEDEEADWDEDEALSEDAQVSPEAGDFFAQRTVTAEGVSLVIRAGVNGSDLDIALDVADGYRLRLAGTYLSGLTVPRVSVEDGKTVLRADRLGDAWSIALNRDGEDWVLTDAASGLAMLRVRVTPRGAKDVRLPEPLPASPEGTAFYSLNDASMEALLGRIARPAASGAVHLLAALPARPLAALMDWLEENDLLTEDVSDYE